MGIINSVKSFVHKKRILLLLIILGCIVAISMIYEKIMSQENYANSNNINSWDVMDYIHLEDIISIHEIVVEEQPDIFTYEIRYFSEENEVVAFLSIPTKVLGQKEASPCIIYNRGGNLDFGLNTAESNAFFSFALDSVVFASQYRGNGGGTGLEQFGGDDLHDVIKLIDISEEFAFVDSDHIYMMGASRGGMMTYMALREDDRIQKGIVVCGLADAFIGYEERIDMRKGVWERLIGGSPIELPEEYKKRSATFWADELKAPVLIIHSTGDPRASYKQVEKMVEKLEEASKEYKLVTYDDDRHGFHDKDWEIMKEWCEIE